MSAPAAYGPCAPWCTKEQVRRCCAGLDKDADLTYPIAFASDVMWALSGRQFGGVCTQTVHPVVCGPQRNIWWTLPGIPWRDEIGWHNSPIGCGCADPCGGRDRIRFPTPLVTFDLVEVDGVALVEGVDYHIEAFRWLVSDGAPFPCSSSTRAMTTTFQFGRAIPDSGQLAAAAFACEIARLTCHGEDDGSCAIPDDVTAMVRDQVTFSFEDTETLFAEGKTGVGLADLWLSTMNPKKLQRRATVHRADDPNRNRRFT